MSIIIHETGEELNRFFEHRSYGSGIENLVIIVILTEPSGTMPHPVTQFSYRRIVRVKFPPLEARDVVEYDIRPEYGLFGQMSPAQAGSYLRRLLVDSTAVLADHADQFPNFDVRKFRQDFESCLAASR
jgi:hypothetical protein